MSLINGLYTILCIAGILLLIQDYVEAKKIKKEKEKENQRNKSGYHFYA